MPIRFLVCSARDQRKSHVVVTKVKNLMFLNEFALVMLLTRTTQQYVFKFIHASID